MDSHKCLNKTGHNKIVFYIALVFITLHMQSISTYITCLHVHKFTVKTIVYVSEACHWAST